MRPDHLTNLCVGDTIVNCFGESLVISKISNNNITVVNTGLETEVYSCSDLYFPNFDDESDEELSWINWAKQNISYVKSRQNIQSVKYIYKNGFANGFVHQNICKAKEQLQK